jgi:hypothetical protein
VSSDPLPLKTRWLALTAATMVYQFSYWPIVAGATADTDPVAAEALEMGVGMVAFGLALVPFVFLVLAFASRHLQAPMAALKGMGLFLLIGLPLGLFDVAVGTAVGYAAGAVPALRGVAGVDVRRRRWIAVGVLFVYLAVLRVLVPPFALLSGAVLPLMIHGLVDQASDPSLRDGAVSGHPG